MKKLFMLGGVLSIATIRLYKYWGKYNSKDVDEIVKLSLHID